MAGLHLPLALPTVVIVSDPQSSWKLESNGFREGYRFFTALTRDWRTTKQNLIGQWRSVFQAGRNFQSGAHSCRRWFVKSLWNSCTLTFMYAMLSFSFKDAQAVEDWSGYLKTNMDYWYLYPFAGTIPGKSVIETNIFRPWFFHVLLIVTAILSAVLLFVIFTIFALYQLLSKWFYLFPHLCPSY